MALALKIRPSQPLGMTDHQTLGGEVRLLVNQTGLAPCMLLLFFVGIRPHLGALEGRRSRDLTYDDSLDCGLFGP